MDTSKYRGLFLSETREHLNTMSALLIALEKDPSDEEGIASLFRIAHSIKGMAASMGYQRTAELAHHLENCLDRFRKGEGVPPEAVDRLLGGVDLLEQLLEDLEKGRSEREVAPFIAAGGAQAPSPPPDAVSVGAATEKRKGTAVDLAIRLLPGAPAAQVLILLQEMGRMGTVLACDPNEERLDGGDGFEVLRARLRTDLEAEEVKARLLKIAEVDRVHLSEARRAEPAARGSHDPGGRSVRVHTELLDRLIDLTGELITSRYMLRESAEVGDWPAMRERLDFQARLISDLHRQVIQARMMPLESVTGRLPRLVRDLARKTGKELALRVEGEDLELDRAILEGVGDALVHLVRNAADHGIRDAGNIFVRGWREKDLAFIEVADDGRGIDPDLIRKRAVERGVVTEKRAASMHKREILQLICAPGFTTSETVTETSGRGVGMDVVKTAVERLGGALQIDSTADEGTRVLLRLPLSVAIIYLLLVEVGGEILGIPFTRVTRVLEAAPGEIFTRGRQSAVALEGEKIPLLSLSKILQMPPARSGARVPIVVSEIRGRTVGLVPDRLIGPRQAFVKGLTPPLRHLPGLGGATILGDGRVIFVIDPESLLEKPRVGVPPGEDA